MPGGKKVSRLKVESCLPLCIADNNFGSTQLQKVLRHAVFGAPKFQKEADEINCINIEL